MREILRDLLESRRIYKANRGFLVAALLTIAIGVGANTAVFSIVDAILLRPLPWPQSEELAVVWLTQLEVEKNYVPARDFFAWRKLSRSFSGLGAIGSSYYNITGEGESEQIVAGQISAGLFDILRVRPRIGRSIRPEEDIPGGAAVALLSHSFWAQRYGGRRDVLGKQITLSGKQHEIIGVMPEGFYLLSKEIVLWVPLAQDAADPRSANYSLEVIGRLAPGVDLQRAQSEMAGIVKVLDAELPANRQGWAARVVSLREDMVGSVRDNLLALWGGAGVLLLISITNVANLLLARGRSRQKEIAVRGALGARPVQLLRQLLAESAVLGFTGAMLGLLFAYAILQLIATRSVVNIPRVEEIRIDAGALIFLAAITLASVALFGAIPAAGLFRPDLARMLREQDRGTAGSRARKIWQRSLVSCQAGLSLMLLTLAGLFLGRFLELQSMHRGFQPGNVLTLRVSLPATRYPGHAERTTYYRELSQRLASLPGVVGASVSTGIPLDGMQGLGMSYSVRGIESTFGPNRPLAETHLITPQYFATLGMRLLQGRFFEETDRTGNVPVVIVSRSVARRYWPEGNAVGGRIVVGSPRMRGTANTEREVVGVVEDVIYPAMTPEASLEIYLPLAQASWPNLYVYARTRGDPAALVSEARRTMHELAPDAPVSAVQPLEERLWSITGAPRFHSQLTGLFAVMALSLTVVGVYGVVSYLMAQETREIAVRIALGAQPADILRMVARQTLGMLVPGLLFGLGGYLFVVRSLSSSLGIGVSGGGYGTALGAAVLLSALAFAASWQPARRASRLDPSQVLHDPPAT